MDSNFKISHIPNKPAAVQDDISALKAAVLNSDFSYLDIPAREHKKRIMSRWPLLSELENQPREQENSGLCR